MKRIGKRKIPDGYWLEYEKLGLTIEETINCVRCHKPLWRHFELAEKDIEELEEAAISYAICGKIHRQVGNAPAETFDYAWVDEPPEEPCDDDFMEEIST